MEAKKVKNFLNEIGEGTSKPYDYEFRYLKGLNEYAANFTTDSGLEYGVSLKPIMNFLEIDFWVEQEGDIYPEVNRGEMFRVMATIMKIVQEAMEIYPDLVGIRYEAHPKGGEEFRQGDRGGQRDKLYRAFLKRNFPDVEFIKNKNSPTVFAKIK